MTQPVQIAVTGAAGQISYALIFRLIAGDLLGPNQPVALHLLEIPAAMSGLEGTVMELYDCAAPLLSSVSITADPQEAFADADLVFLLGARPRGPGMERRDLLESNAAIFSEQGRALNAVAKTSVRVLTVGNPANTNALIAAHNAPRLGAKSFSAMTRLDHNRAVGLLARRCEQPIDAVRKVAIWGNHSPTQYPDLHHATVAGRPALDCVDAVWYRDEFIPSVQQRGTHIIRIRGKSSAASAANAALEHMRTWITQTRDSDWVSMAVASDGSYGIEPGLMYSFPVVVKGGECRIVADLPIDEFSRQKMSATEAELKEERDLVRHLLR